MEIKVTISGKVELVKCNLRKVEISGGINLNLEVKQCWCNRPLVVHPVISLQPWQACDCSIDVCIMLHL